MGEAKLSEVILTGASRKTAIERADKELQRQILYLGRRRELLNRPHIAGRALIDEILRGTEWFHVLDRTRLPEALQSVDWKLMSEFDGWLWEDCCRLLVAVPVVRDGDRWCYELSVVTRTLCSVDMDGESWGWSMDDIEWFVVLSGAAPIPNEEEDGSCK